MASSGTSKCEGQLCKSHADQGSGVSLPTSPSLWSPFRGDDLHSPVVTIELRTTWQVMDGDDQEQRQTHLRYRRQPRPHGSGLHWPPARTRRKRATQIIDRKVAKVGRPGHSRRRWPRHQGRSAPSATASNFKGQPAKLIARKASPLSLAVRTESLTPLTSKPRLSGASSLHQIRWLIRAASSATSPVTCRQRGVIRPKNSMCAVVDTGPQISRPLLWLRRS